MSCVETKNNRRAKYYSLTAREKTAQRGSQKLAGRLGGDRASAQTRGGRGVIMSQQASRLFGGLAAFDPELLRKEIDEELALHVELTAADLVREGLTPAEANCEAQQRFGDQEKFGRECFRIQTREKIMLQKLHLLWTFVLLIVVLRFASSSERAGSLNPIESAQQLVCDATKMEHERLRGLHWLRFSGSLRVEAMIELAKSTASPEIRADIFRQLDEVTLPILKAPLFDALTYDPSAVVRSEAAETFAHYLGSEAVVNALEKSAANDESQEVRDEAKQSLGER